MPRTLPPPKGARPALPRVLFLSATMEDYLADSLLHGLRSLLGAHLVDAPRCDRSYRDYPDEERRRLYGRGFTLYGLLNDVDVNRNSVLDKAKAGEFDLVVVSDIWRDFGRWVELAPEARHVPIAVLDGADSPALYPYAPKWWRVPLWWSLPRAHTRVAYFKRELTPLTATFRTFLLVPPPLNRAVGPHPNVRPISFSIPEEKIVTGGPQKRRLLGTHVVDPEVARAMGARTSYAFEHEDDYVRDLRESRFAVTTKRAGWDAMRHYEIAAQGCVPCVRDLQRKPASCAPHGLDETNCVPYTSARSLLRRLDRMGDDEYSRLRKGALDWARRNSTRARARQFLGALGFPLPEHP